MACALFSLSLFLSLSLSLCVCVCVQVVGNDIKVDGVLLNVTVGSEITVSGITVQRVEMMLDASSRATHGHRRRYARACALLPARRRRRRRRTEMMPPHTYRLRRYIGTSTIHILLGNPYIKITSTSIPDQGVHQPTRLTHTVRALPLPPVPTDREVALRVHCRCRRATSKTSLSRSPSRPSPRYPHAHPHTPSATAV
jgi:hypothetical protein